MIPSDGMSETAPPLHIETHRLILRPAVRGDAESIFRYAGSPAVTCFTDFARHTSLRDSEAFALECERAWDSGTAAPWAIVLKATREFIGAIELRMRPPKADFGYVLNEAFWGHGYATEAATAVVNWAIAQPSIYRVWATCDPDNRASARVLEKAGLLYEARLENWVARPQRGQAAGPSLIYGIIRPT